MGFDGKAFGLEIVQAVKEHVSSAVGPIVTRLEALERRFEILPTPKDGKDADEEAIIAAVSEKMAGELSEIRSALAALQEPAEPIDIAAMVADAVAALPVPQDGKDADEAAIVVSVTEKIAAELDVIREAVANIPTPELPDVAAMVAEAVSALPVPQDGKSVTVEDVAPLIEDAVAKAVAALPKPKDGEPGRDGLDVKDMFRAEGNRLIAVLSDGSTKDLGVFVGKDGNDGNPGRDGLGFDDMKHEIRDEGVYLVCERGDVAKEAFMPVPFYRGVWSKDAGYRAGNNVTWGGSTWIATKDAPQGKPDAPDSDWVLSNKRGRDGKDALQ